MNLSARAHAALLGSMFFAAALAVLVLHTANGGIERFEDKYALALAKEGFVALAANYLHLSIERRFSHRFDAARRLRSQGIPSTV